MGELAGLPWMQTKSGRKFPLVDPAPEDIFWPDVAWHIAHINRFAGAAGEYSVAQHSMLVAEHLPEEIRPYGLLHDAHEFAIGDITTPAFDTIRWWLERILGAEQGEDAARSAFTYMKERIDQSIFAAAELPWPMPPEVKAAVKEADIRAMKTERRDLMALPPEAWKAKYEAYESFPEKIVPWKAEAAYYAFSMELSRTLGLTLSKKLLNGKNVASTSNTAQA